MGSCGYQSDQCVFYERLYNVKNYQYGVIGCKKGKRKIYIYMTPKCANYIRAHIANFSHYISRYKIQINAKKR